MKPILDGAAGSVDDGAIRYDLDTRHHGAIGDTVTVLPPGVAHNGYPSERSVPPARYAASATSLTNAIRMVVTPRAAAPMGKASP